LWIALAVSGASALARTLPSAFLALKVAGIGYILVLAWRTAHSRYARPRPGASRRRADGFSGGGLGVQLANPNALVFFGGLAAGIPRSRAVRSVVQCAVVMATVTDDRALRPSALRRRRALARPPLRVADVRRGFCRGAAADDGRVGAVRGVVDVDTGCWMSPQPVGW
jgi:threonine/homoserine/homoserine lactone efflux protein